MSDALVERLAGVLEGHWQSSDPRTHEATCGCYWSSGEHFLADAEGAHEAWVAHLADALAPTVEGLLAAARAEALLEAARGVRNYPPDLDLGDAPARGDWWIRQAVGLWLENRAARIARTAAQPATGTEGSARECRYPCPCGEGEPHCACSDQHNEPAASAEGER